LALAGATALERQSTHNTPTAHGLDDGDDGDGFTGATQEAISLLTEARRMYAALNDVTNLRAVRIVLD
jgi:hypothetical protein